MNAHAEPQPLASRSRRFLHANSHHAIPLMLAGLATMSSQALGQDCACPPFAIEEQPEQNIWQLDLCEESNFCDLNAAIDYIMGRNDLAGDTVVLRVPGKIYNFSTTIDIEFSHQTPKELKVVAKESGNTPIFKNAIAADPIVGRRLFHAVNDIGFSGVTRYLEFNNITFIGNENFDATSASSSLPSTKEYVCESAGDNWTWEYRSGIETRLLDLIAIDCSFTGFATQLYRDMYSKQAHPHTLDGAAIYILGAGRLENCTFTNNFVGDERTWDSENCTCDKWDEYCVNIYEHRGGAVFHDANVNANGINNNLVVSNNCKFESNVAQKYGGAIFAAWSEYSSSQLDLTNSVFVGNIVELSCQSINSCRYGPSRGGGAIAMGGPGLGRISECQFIGNEVQNGQGECPSNDEDTRPRGRGGAIWANAYCMIQDSHFEDNKANGGSGSAICFWNVSGDSPPFSCKQGLNVENCTIISSTDPEEVGALIAIDGKNDPFPDAGLDLGIDDCPNLEDLENGTSRFNAIVSSTLHSRSSEKALYVDNDSAAIASSLVQIDNGGPAILVESSPIIDTCVYPVPLSQTASLYAVDTNFCATSDENCIVQLNICREAPLAECYQVIDFSRAYIKDCSYSGFTGVFCQPADQYPVPACWSSGNTPIQDACTKPYYCQLTCESCPADFPTPTRNNKVDGGDLAYLLGYWGMEQADINCDGLTDGADLATLLGDWGPCPIEP